MSKKKNLGVPGSEQPVALSAVSLPAVGDAAPIANAPPHDYTHAQWLAEAERRFGPDVMKWRFLCPACGWAATIQEWKDVGADETEAAFSCIGRRTPIPTQCNYAGGGLFRINPVRVLRESGNTTTVFAFAPDDHVQPTKLSGFRQR